MTAAAILALILALLLVALAVSAYGAHLVTVARLELEKCIYRKALERIELMCTYTPTTPETGNDAENLAMAQDIIEGVCQETNRAFCASRKIP